MPKAPVPSVYPHAHTAMPAGLKNANKLLSDIVDGLQSVKVGRAEVRSVYVIFHCGDNELEFTLLSALDSIVNDLYFDERGDFSEADKAIVRVY